MSPELLAIEDARKILLAASDTFYSNPMVIHFYGEHSIERYALRKLSSADRYLSDQRTAYLEGDR